MKAGDLVRTKNIPYLGLIGKKKDIYSSWGIRHVYVHWANGASEYYPAIWLEVRYESR